MIQVRTLPELSSMILAWAALFLLFLMLRHFLHKPVSKALSDRQEKIKSDIDGAKVLREEATALKDGYESKISHAKKESQEIIESARKRGEELKEGIVVEARKEAEAIISRARREIVREREVAFQDIKSQAGEMAVLIASKIMEEKINMDSQKGLIDKFIDEVGNSKWQS
ncbi:F0F1 ATP synthase subunit B [Tissierella sp.]|uniref:F0F1 ATP synthase subunit B n=1 Tax=Tissierella sp. TaxID=41274 RepID=UPI002856491A|nr:F0F1 ATP synthase subunit B [Tissierella sp.]MDR7856946.1 F0F1 ATP synthase subunit B [Tissierella sp.]